MRENPAFGALGPLRSLIELPGVTDVLVNGPDQIWIDRGAGLEQVPLRLGDHQRLRTLAMAVISAGGRHLDDATPFVDVRLGDLRVHAVLPPIAVAAVQLSIRVPQPGLTQLTQLVAAGMLQPQQHEMLAQMVHRGDNVLPRTPSRRWLKSVEPSPTRSHALSPLTHSPKSSLLATLARGGARRHWLGAVL